MSCHKDFSIFRFPTFHFQPFVPLSLPRTRTTLRVVLPRKAFVSFQPSYLFPYSLLPFSPLSFFAVLSKTLISKNNTETFFIGFKVAIYDRGSCWITFPLSTRSVRKKNRIFDKSLSKCASKFVFILGNVSRKNQKRTYSLVWSFGREERDKKDKSVSHFPGGS